VQLAPNNKDFRHMRAVAAQGLGMLTKAATDYSILFSSKPYLFFLSFFLLYSSLFFSFSLSALFYF
jgi:hypothetical protein